MTGSNYDDVLAQLHAAGLVVSSLDVSGKMVRCKTEDDHREKRGWYILHDFMTSRGTPLIVGSFGIWRGNEQNAQKIELRKGEVDPEEAKAMRKRMAEDRKAAEQALKRQYAKAAARAIAMWARLSNDGDAPYLATKHVQAFGLRFTPNGTAVVPLLDTQGRMHGLQFLRTVSMAEKCHRPAKEFWPSGLAKKGHFHLIGNPGEILLVAEGYATAASLHMATGYPVAVTFDAGNITPVVDALHKRYPRTRILICADNDDLGKCRSCKTRIALARHPTDCPNCAQPHGIVNTGVGAAASAALTSDGAWIAPTFADMDGRAARYIESGNKNTDFNDLHVAEGLHIVRTQVSAQLTELGWDAVPRVDASSSAQGEGDALRPIGTTAELLERYSLVYGHGGAVFDHREHRLLSIADMREACQFRWVHKGWTESASRRMVRPTEVGFDPTGLDATVTCNLYGGWPTIPQAGNCERLLDLLYYMCCADSNPEALYQWLLCWIAYPIQHPGAKMKTTVVVHGPQGTGKNLFFEALMKIYGEYGDVLDQSAVEDKFNDWASRKLFLIADEVVARTDVYHIKNKLKALITGDRIRINPKNFAAYWERNHLNMVFLSNETMPVVLEEDDRRHCVIWTPAKATVDYYAGVRAEIAAGGIAALHDYLLHLDLGDFDPGTAPPRTDAKADLIQLSLDSPLRFYDALRDNDIPKLQLLCGTSNDWYQVYSHWCRRDGCRAAPKDKFVASLMKKRGIERKRARYDVAGVTRDMATFLMFAGTEPPEGVTFQSWLGGQWEAMRTCMADYFGHLSGGGDL